MSSIKVYKPTTNARRKTSVINYKESLTTDKPFKKLLVKKSKTAGRNQSGKITVRHHGGGARKLIRQIDFKRNFPEGFKVLTVEYDPGRTAFISLVSDLQSGVKKYIINSQGIEVDKKYIPSNEIFDGNQVQLKFVPVGTAVSQVEFKPNQGSRLLRSAGTYATVTAKDDGYVTLKLASGEIRKFQENCTCVISRVSNEEHNLVRLGKAGRSRHMGIRPTVRGKVMNPVDHPHGGGEAANSIGMAYPKTPWGKHALGVKTRSKSNLSSKFIVKRRTKK